ncbi:hypothetical protein GCM10023093_09630 [Nemorincola caseinilytica]|uniref:Secretion system C-terminal sorting domain-containing protein n=2 Tax=Nemorincola caseinilytica TaxID=2054315 RepID=A0ABP8NBR0_9BACT
MFGAKNADAQSFSSQHDTVWVNVPGTFNAANHLNNLTSGNITYRWSVVATNCPADWLATLGVCDNVGCYSSTDIWPASSSTVKTSAPYAPGLGDFHVQGDLSAVSTPGPYYVKIYIANKDVSTDTAVQTYIISRSATSTPSVPKITNEVALYPNPATSSVNVVYDAATDVKNIAIYSIIGKQMNIYRPVGNSANLNIEALPDGIYFLRLLNSRGEVVATRKFTKQ